jgi:hypothetical protein
VASKFVAEPCDKRHSAFFKDLIISELKQGMAKHAERMDSIPDAVLIMQARRTRHCGHRHDAGLRVVLEILRETNAAGRRDETHRGGDLRALESCK